MKFVLFISVMMLSSCKQFKSEPQRRLCPSSLIDMYKRNLIFRLGFTKDISGICFQPLYPNTFYWKENKNWKEYKVVERISVKP